MVMMPYNPPYYQTLVENAGFGKVMDLYSMYLDRALIEKHETPLAQFRQYQTFLEAGLFAKKTAAPDIGATVPTGKSGGGSKDLFTYDPNKFRSL